MEPVLREKNARRYIAWYCLKAFMSSVKQTAFRILPANKCLLCSLHTNLCFWSFVAKDAQYCPLITFASSSVCLSLFSGSSSKVYYTVWNMQYNHICQMMFYNRVQKGSYLRGFWEGFQTGKLKVSSCLLRIDLKFKKSALGFQHGRWLDIFTVS